MRNNGLKVLPALVVIALCFMTGFSSNDDIKIVEKLISERTDIIQKCIYGEIEKSVGEKRLCKIEIYPLLNEDIESLRNYEFTQIDMVKKMTIIDSKKINEIFDYSTYEVIILWNMLGLSEKYEFTGKYYVVTKKIGKNKYLSSIEPIK